MRTFILTRIKLNLMRPVLLALKIGKLTIACLLLTGSLCAQTLLIDKSPCSRCKADIPPSIEKSLSRIDQPKFGGRYYCSRNLGFLWDDGDTSGGRWLI